MSNALDRILIDATEIGAINVVKAAIQDGADVNAASNFRTPLTNSVYNGHFDIVKILIDNGAKANGPNLLISAAKRHDIGILKLLLDAGMDINAKETDKAGNTALIICNDEETAQFLIERGADINIARDIDGLTALMFAVADSNFKLVKLLIASGADTSIRDSKGRDVLEIATFISDRSPEIIKFLVDEMCRAEAEVPL